MDMVPGLYTLASAIAACIASGADLEEVVAMPRDYTWRTLSGALSRHGVIRSLTSILRGRMNAPPARCLKFCAAFMPSPLTSPMGAFALLASAVFCRRMPLVAQYRDKRSEPSERRRQRGGLADLCRRGGGATMMSNWPGCRRGNPPRAGETAIRLRQSERLPAGALSSASLATTTSTLPARRAAAGDYVAFGAVFLHPLPKAVVAPLELFARCRRNSLSPHARSEWRHPGERPLAIAAGADLLAVITDLFSVPDLTVRHSPINACSRIPFHDLPQPATV